MSRCIVLFVLFFLARIPCATQVLENQTNEPGINSSISTQSHPAQRPETAISILRLREPRKVQQLYRKAINAWLKQKPTEAQRLLKQALDLYPGFPEALTFNAVIHASFHQWSLAEQQLLTAIQSDPDYSPAYVVLAGVYNSQGRFDDAEQATNQARASGGDSWYLQYEMARALIGKQQYTKALATAEAALNAKKHGSILRLAKAHALLGLRRYSQAAGELRTYLRDEPSGDGSKNARDLLEQLQNIVQEEMAGNPGN